MLIFGNFNQPGQTKRGWFMGIFMDPTSPFCQAGFELKWGKEAGGTEKPALGTNNTAHTLTILIYGDFINEFPDTNQQFRMQKEGDYVYYPPGTPHTWRALKDSFLITIRWPSKAGDQENMKTREH